MTELVEIVAEVLAEHRELRGPSGNQEAQCECGWNGGLVALHRAHQAERVVERLGIEAISVWPYEERETTLYRVRALEVGERVEE